MLCAMCVCGCLFWVSWQGQEVADGVCDQPEGCPFDFDCHEMKSLCRINQLMGVAPLALLHPLPILVAGGGPILIGNDDDAFGSAWLMWMTENVPPS